MTTLGNRLRHARVVQGLTTGDLAATTKLPVRTIDAIEQDRFDRLPHGILGRSQVRACATALGLDGDAAVADYLQLRFGSDEEALPIARPRAVEPEQYPGLHLLGGLVAAAAAFAIFYSYHQSGSPADRTESSPFIESRDLTRTDAVVVWPMVVADRDWRDLRIDVRPNGPCWLSAAADDEPIVQQLLQAGDHTVVSARNTIVLRVGDPGTFVYWINGSPGLPLGSPGKPITIEITKENAHTLVAASAVSGGEAPGT